MGPGMQQRCRCRRGFTLLEVMVALAILAIAMPILLRSAAQSLSLAAQARFLAVAAQLAQEKMTERLLDGEAAPVDDGGDFEAPFADYAWRVETDRQEAGPPLPAGVGLRVETVEITDRRQPDLRYRLVRYRPEVRP